MFMYESWQSADFGVKPTYSVTETLENDRNLEASCR